MPALFDDVVKPIKALTALFDGLSKIDVVVRRFVANKRFSDLLSVLKVLYFSPEGTRGILTKIAKGSPVSSEDIHRMHRTVSDQTNINEALEVLVLDELRRWPELAVVDFEAIAYLRYGKADLRGRLARFAKEYQQVLDNLEMLNSVTERLDEFRRVSEELLNEISLFNAAIEALDTRLRTIQSG